MSNHHIDLQGKSIDPLATIRADQRAAAAVDRELQKEVLQINARAAGTDAMPVMVRGHVATFVDGRGSTYEVTDDKIEVWQAVHEPLGPLIESKMQTNRTGLRDALGILRDRMAKAKERSQDASVKIDEALTRHERATSQIITVAGEIEREADDVMAELGQFSNGGPA